ncbi:MAG TPA: tetratricopeptide repeat protein [Bacteroidales bacterium]|nr:tetratricopeptide repeat protein [Bacteroidales bacterium]
MKFLLKLILPICIYCFLPAPAVYCQTSSDFNKGVENYSAGNYEEALKIWLNIYETGKRSANLNYNIGNAYFKLGNVPNSILFYERAYLLDPSDDNINYNLEIARSLTVDRFQEIPELFFVKWFNLISLSLHGNTWSIISIIAFVLCLGLLSLFIYSSSYSRKVLGFWLAVVFFVISVSSIFLSLQNRTLVYDSHKAIITMPQVSGKSSPDNSGTDLFVIHEGTKVAMVDKVGDWYEIVLSDGNKGWIPASSLSVI